MTIVLEDDIAILQYSVNYSFKAYALESSFVQIYLFSTFFVGHINRINVKSGCNCIKKIPVG